MTDVVTAEDRGPVADVAAALADLLHGRVRPVEMEPPDEAATARRFLAALRDPAVVAGALAASPDPCAACWSVMALADKPLLLVPPAVRACRSHVGRVLLPLDGRPESAEAVQDLAGLFDLAGVDLLVLHVFQPASVPMFWDQHAHARRAWTNEFLSRTGAPKGTRMELRSGVPAEHVRRVAQAEDVDLIALGWSRNMAAGRAQTVRESVLHAPAPVLLLPISTRRAARREQKVHGR